MDPLESWRKRLVALRPRHQLVLRLHFLEGRPFTDCATFLGIPPSAHELLFFRATQELLRQPEDSDPTREGRHAKQLANALSNDELPANTPVRSMATALVELKQIGQPLRQYMIRWEDEQDRSPLRQKQEWLRWAAVAIVLALALLGYLR